MSTRQRFKNIFAVLVIVSFMISVERGLSYAQPKIPKEKIPSDISSDVKKQIERLYSSDLAERISAVWSLGEMGKKASSAVPFLIGMLGDNTLFRYNDSLTSIGGEAIDMLGKIKDPCAIGSLIAALKETDSDVRKYDTLALGKIKNPSTDKKPRSGSTISKRDSSGTYVEYEIKDPRAADLLRVAVKARSSAALALKEITGKDFGENVKEWQEWWQKNGGKE